MLSDKIICRHPKMLTITASIVSLNLNQLELDEHMRKIHKPDLE
jgi:hypothetical protein